MRAPDRAWGAGGQAADRRPRWAGQQYVYGCRAGTYVYAYFCTSRSPSRHGVFFSLFSFSMDALASSTFRMGARGACAISFGVWLTPVFPRVVKISELRVDSMCYRQDIEIVTG